MVLDIIPKIPCAQLTKSGIGEVLTGHSLWVSDAPVARALQLPDVLGVERAGMASPKGVHERQPRVARPGVPQVDLLNRTTRDPRLHLDGGVIEEQRGIADDQTGI